MENTEIGKYARSFGLSFAITSILSALIVIIKESNEESVLAWMKAATGHHWVTHGVINVVLFVVLGWALSKLSDGQGVKISVNGLVGCIVGAVLISGLLIAGFYI
jgi:lipoprotein signal peptidase